jgi:hypothetical protein
MAQKKYQKWVPDYAIDNFKNDLVLALERERKLTEPLSKEFVNAGMEYQCARTKCAEIAALKLDSIRKLETLLVTDDNDVQGFWKMLNANHEWRGSKRLEPFPHASFFLTIAIRWVMGPIGGERLTPTKQEAWINKVEKASRALSKLVKNTYLDNYLIEYGPVLENAMFLPLSATLEQFGDRAQRFIPKPATTKRGDADMRRAYFARELSNYVMQHFGNPCRKIVLSIVNLVFSKTSDQEMSLRQLQKLAPQKAIAITKSKRLNTKGGMTLNRIVC